MLHTNKILSLRDLALDHLPKVRAKRDRMKAHGSIAALSAVAIAPLKTSHDVASTTIEKQAAVLLHWVHQHPDTSTEWLIPSVDNSEKELEEILMKDALRNQPMTEVNMLESAKLLCELSGAPLPPWMTITPAAKVVAVPVVSPSGNTVEEQAADVDHDETLADLFDSVPVEALEKMFPTNDKWKSWAEKAASNGLKIARTERAKFNPYKAGVWFVRKGVEGWDVARLYRTLANNLPTRSRDEKYLLTDNLD